MAVRWQWRDTDGDQKERVQCLCKGSDPGQ